MAAYRRTMAKRFFNMAKASASASSSSSPARTTMTYASLINKHKLPNQEQGIRSRLFFQPAAAVPADTVFDRIRGLDGPPMPMPPMPAPTGKEMDVRKSASYMSIEEAKKVLRASQMEAVRARLRGADRARVSYSEFVDVCCDASGGFEQGMSVAKLLDESGAVIVLGNVVFLRPDQVARAIERVMHPTTMPREEREELKEMEAKKAEIDGKAEAMVRREMWCGLGLLLLQTTGFMRLTFWELSWDVMEPICFFVTSVYFMAGYAFFLGTSRDPSFEGFFQSRFAAKQRRLMRAHNFDMGRFNELRKKAAAQAAAGALPDLSPNACNCEHNRDKTLLGFGHCNLEEG